MVGMVGRITRCSREQSMAASNNNKHYYYYILSMPRRRLSQPQQLRGYLYSLHLVIYQVHPLSLPGSPRSLSLIMSRRSSRLSLTSGSRPPPPRASPVTNQYSRQSKIQPGNKPSDSTLSQFIQSHRIACFLYVTSSLAVSHRNDRENVFINTIKLYYSALIWDIALIMML